MSAAPATFHFLCPLIRLCHSPLPAWTRNSAHLWIHPKESSHRKASVSNENHLRFQGPTEEGVHLSTCSDNNKEASPHKTALFSRQSSPSSHPSPEVLVFHQLLPLTGFRAPGSSLLDFSHFLLPLLYRAIHSALQLLLPPLLLNAPLRSVKLGSLQVHNPLHLETSNRFN